MEICLNRKKYRAGYDKDQYLGPLCLLFLFMIYQAFCRRLKNVGLTYMQRDLDELVKWSTKMLFPFNKRKCKAIHFGNHNLQLGYLMNGHILEHVNDEKDLGIDKHLKFHKHASIAIKKANQGLGVI